LCPRGEHTLQLGRRRSFERRRGPVRSFRRRSQAALQGQGAPLRLEEQLPRAAAVARDAPPARGRERRRLAGEQVQSPAAEAQGIEGRGVRAANVVGS